MDLNNLMAVVFEHWPFDYDNYPRMQKLSEEEKRAFIIRHILMHQAKAVAKVTEAVEPFDHGAPLDHNKLQLSTRNFFINTLRLASAIGISSEELAAYVQQWVSEKHKP